MKLFLDAGNTRVKWGIRSGGGWREQGALAHDEVELLAEHLPAGRIDAAWGVNVAGAALAGRLAAALAGSGLVPNWLQAEARALDVRNGYTQPGRLGADRWAALIGARGLTRSACLVVTAGTATTVDVLDVDGLFRGGLILPGLELMRRSLAGNTAQLPFADGQFADFPQNTADAIVSGCLHAQAGAVERMFCNIAAEPGAQCLLNGGAAGELASVLKIPFRKTDNLVLEGLARLAENQ